MRKRSAALRQPAKKRDFGRTKEFRAACLTGDELAETRQKIRDYYVAQKIAEESARLLAEKLKGLEPVDIRPLQEEFDQKEKAQKTAEAVFAENESGRGALLEKAVETAEEYVKKLKGMTEKFVELDEFSKMLRGSNGISLQRYILGVMLTAITREANILLKKVHDGRYQLYRSMEGTGRARKVGLDLAVFDSYSGERRSVESLSREAKNFWLHWHCLLGFRPLCRPRAEVSISTHCLLTKALALSILHPSKTRLTFWRVCGADRS